MILLNPKNRKRFYPDKRSEEIMQKTIAFFENKGKASIKKDDQERIWYQEFIDFIGKEEVFADLLTPAKYGTKNSRWDMWRIQEFNEILGFYGLPYWYVWQVTILGLGPIWMSDNEKAKEKAAQLLRSGSVFAFGLSEKTHGADVYSTEMRLTKQADGNYLANGSKYYIGNANKADMVSTFGKLDNDEYVFFAANYQHSKYDLVKNTVNSQNYVGEYALRDYPVSEEVVNLMWDVIAAKGFEKDTFFEMVTRDIRALPKLEGTVHVNIALIIKFMQNFLFIPKDYPEIPQRSDAADDVFLFNQGPTHGLGKIQFHDYNKALNLFDLPNIRIFQKQLNLFKESLIKAPPSPEQAKNVDVMLTIGEMFTLVPYAQLILENAKIMQIDEVLIDQIFDFIVRDFSKFALEMYNRPSSTEKQMEYCLRMIQKPNVDSARSKTVWKDFVYANVDAYEMNP